MRKSLSLLLGLIAVFAFAGIAFAAESTDAAGAAGAIDVTQVIITVVVGMSVVALGCAAAQCVGVVTAVSGTARNPEAGGRLMVTLILGLAFIESMAIYALVVNLIILMTKI